MRLSATLRFLLVCIAILASLACSFLTAEENSENPATTLEIQPINIQTPDQADLIEDQATDTPQSPLLPKFVFVTHRENSMEIYGSQRDGSYVVQLTFTDSVNNWNPAFSPDCTQIVYQADTTGSNQIYILQLGSDAPPVALTSPDAFTEAEMPSWSPVGDKIAFSGRFVGENTNSIFLISTDGTEYKRLEPQNSPGRDDCPSWSPNGEQIAYLTTPSGATHYLALMNSNGSDSKIIQSFKYPDYGCPSWSPDGTRLAVVIQGEGNNGDIAIVNMDGSGIENLTNRDGRDWEPAWSPDSKHIAFMYAELGEGFDIYLVDLDGGSLTPLFSSDINEHQPAFCPIP